jgi:MHS family alpha-ketoglutarate permease-like MFS transporter
MGTIATIPLLRALQSTRSALVAFLLIAAAWLIVAGYTSINAIVKAELFPTRVRATGVGLPFAVTVSILAARSIQSRCGSSRSATRPGSPTT